MDAQELVAREKLALATHVSVWHGGVLPPPRSAPRSTFVHGLMLPLSLLAAVWRDRELRAPFLRLALARNGVLVLLAGMALATDKVDTDESKKGVSVTYRRDADSKDPPVNVTLPGIQVHLGNDHQADEVSVLGQSVPVVPPSVPAPPATPGEGFWARGWARIVAVVGTLTVLEGLIVLFTRRWDDWLSFHMARLAGIRPETPEAPTRRLSFDLRWLMRKLRKRMGGYLLFASGMPVLALLKLVPVIGSVLFGAGVTLWAWYWVGVFTASKSAHAWADKGVAPPPAVVQAFTAGVPRHVWTWPLRVYGRIWARLVRTVNSPAGAFDRSPAAFLGLALARAILALPGLYLVARPLVPVAAGRLCAESDPADRFSIG